MTQAIPSEMQEEADAPGPEEFSVVNEHLESEENVIDPVIHDDEDIELDGLLLSQVACDYEEEQDSKAVNSSGMNGDISKHVDSVPSGAEEVALSTLRPSTLLRTGTETSLEGLDADVSDRAQSPVLKKLMSRQDSEEEAGKRHEIVASAVRRQRRKSSLFSNRSRSSLEGRQTQKLKDKGAHLNGDNTDSQNPSAAASPQVEPLDSAKDNAKDPPQSNVGGTESKAPLKPPNLYITKSSSTSLSLFSKRKSSEGPETRGRLTQSQSVLETSPTAMRSSWSKVRNVAKLISAFGGQKPGVPEVSSLPRSASRQALLDAVTQTDKEEIHLPTNAVEAFLKDVVVTSGLAYGELWVRPRKTHAIRRGSLKHMKGLSKSIRGSSRAAKHASPGGGQGSPFTAAVAHHRSGSGDEADDEEDQHYLSSHLKFSGHKIVMTDQFPQDESKKLQLQLFQEQANGMQYDKGEGFPGLAWTRKDLDWHDIDALPADDDLAADLRVITAKKIFAMSVGVPAVDPFSGQLLAVIMLYGINDGKTRLRSDKFLRQYQKSDRLKTIFASASQSLPAVLEVETALQAWNQTKAEVDKDGQDLLLDAELMAAAAAQYERPRDLYGKLWYFAVGWTDPSRIKTYFKKWRGQKATPPGGHDVSYSMWSFVGTFIAMLCVSALDEWMTGLEYRSDTLFALIGSFGAVATMLFGAPTSPLVQPRNIIGGHIISVAVALSFDYLVNEDFFPIIPQWVANALVPALSTALMTKVGLIHPPAGACATIYITGDEQVKNMGWMFFCVPVLVDCVLMIALALLLNNLSRSRKYPQYW